MAPKYASVILDTGIELDYIIPPDILVNVGDRVEVPLKSSFKKGIISGLKDSPSYKRMVPIKALIEPMLFSKELFSLARWISSYYFTPLAKVLKWMFPPSVKNDIQPRKEIFISLISKPQILEVYPKLKTEAQRKVLDLLLKAEKALPLATLLKEVSRSPIDTLVKEKILKIEERQAIDELLLEQPFFSTKPKKLNGEQEDALNKISASLESNAFAPHLLFGVTGSGKTEVYLQAIQKALSLNKNSLMLVPEIALTPQTIERFRSRFPDQIAVLHHKRSLGERWSSWQNLKSNKAHIAIGARSAVFSPVQNLGLIIVDEEHDSSYKQTEEAPTYHARNVAIMRAKLENATIILGSATPSLESYFNAVRGKYTLSTLEKRANNASLAKVQIVDMKSDQNRGQSYFSDLLLSGIKDRFGKGEQSLLFLNRRGYNALLICNLCNSTLKCIHCDVSLTFHKEENRLNCHICGYGIIPPKICPECKKGEALQYKGFGTEHIERSLKAIFPGIRTLRIDRDTTTKKHSHELLFKQFRSGKADVLIGTQMIVKGLHFPAVTLVGVLNADSTLNIPDFRSSENLFQLLTQVSGRAGRDETPGEVIIQTYKPDNATIRWASEQNFLKFYSNEIEERRLFEYPPFTKIIKLLFTGKDESLTRTAAENFYNVARKNLSQNIKLHPVASSGHAKIKDKFRFQFLLRAPKNCSLPNLHNLAPLPGQVKLLIDTDPTSTFF